MIDVNTHTAAIVCLFLYISPLFASPNSQCSAVVSIVHPNWTWAVVPNTFMKAKGVIVNFI